MRVTFKYGYSFVILFMIASMTIGSISSSYHVLQKTDCVPIYIYAILIVAVLLYLMITVFYIRSKQDLLWGILMYVEAVFFSFIIGMTIIHTEKQKFYNIHIENSIPDSQITIKRKEIEKETDRKIFISYANQGIKIRFKRSIDNKKDQEVLSYIRELLSSPKSK